LAGQAVGAALVIDMSQYLNKVISFDADHKTVTEEPGMNLDTLNRRMKEHGLMFGPDPSSGNRTTVGGAVGNNSSGAHSILYGMTSEHIVSAKVQLASGDIVELGPGTIEEHTERATHNDPTGRLLKQLLDFRERHAEVIEREFPPHWRRATGYSLDQFVKDGENFNPARLMAASEGTLGMLLNITMTLVDLPERTALVLLQFDDLVKAMEATNAILEVDPSAVELMDRMLIDLTR